MQCPYCEGNCPNDEEFSCDEYQAGGFQVTMKDISEMTLEECRDAVSSLGSEIEAQGRAIVEAIINDDQEARLEADEKRRIAEERFENCIDRIEEIRNLRQTVKYVVVKLHIEHHKDVNVDEVMSELEYDFTSTCDESEVLTTEIVEFSDTHP